MMDAASILIMKEVLLALNVLDAAQPYLNKISSMNDSGASGEDILAATQEMRRASGNKLDQHLSEAPQ